jgi:hypothetical protein
MKIGEASLGFTRDKDHAHTPHHFFLSVIIRSDERTCSDFTEDHAQFHNGLLQAEER